MRPIELVVGKAQTSRHGALRTVDLRCDAGTRSAARAAASLPLLRWSHDRHRGPHTRLLAHSQAATGGHRHQDRHVMSSRLVPDQSAALAHRCPSPTSPPLAPHKANGALCACSAHRSPPRTIAVACRRAQSLLERRFRPHPRRTITAPHPKCPASIGIAPAAPPLAFLRRRPEPVALLVMPASEKAAPAADGLARSGR